MALKNCPKCGEKYSDTYRSCPFCEEDEALRGGKGLRRGKRGGGKRAAQRFSLLSSLLLLAILVMAGLLAYLLFSSHVTTQPLDQADPTPISDTTTDTIDNSDSAADTADTTGAAEDDVPVDPDSLPETLTLSYLGSPKQEFTMKVGDDPIALTASGGSGPYTWSSTDESVLTVDADGTVTAVAAGSATLTVYDSTGKGSCAVIVKAGETATSQSSSSGQLNRTDFTRSTSEGAFQLKVSGVTDSITWSSSNTSVATVTSDGQVQAVGAGTATITASWGGNSLQCIVRVPN